MEYVLRRLLANAEAARRLRIAASKLPIEDEHCTSDDGKRGVWREAWRAAHSRHNEQVKANEAERKSIHTALEWFHKYYDPQTVADRELLKEFKRIKSGQIPRAEADN